MESPLGSSWVPYTAVLIYTSLVTILEDCGSYKEVASSLEVPMDLGAVCRHLGVQGFTVDTEHPA